MMTTLLNQTRPGALLDGAGVIFSCICAIHCILMPVVISFFPVLGFGILADEGIEWAFVTISLLIACLSLVPAYFRKHKSLRVLLIFVAGITLVIAADKIFEDNLAGKAVVLALGAGSISLAHLLNRSLCKNCSLCQLEQ